MDQWVNIRRAWVRIILTVAAIVLARGLADTAFATPPASPGAAGLAPADLRLAQDLGRAILKRMAATPRPAVGCGPATLDSLREAARAVIDGSKASSGVTLAAVALARQQAPASDPCLSVALDETRAEFAGHGATLPGVAAIKGFPLPSSAAKPKDRRPSPAAPVRPQPAPIVVASQGQAQAQPAREDAARRALAQFQRQQQQAQTEAARRAAAQQEAQQAQAAPVDPARLQRLQALRQRALEAETSALDNIASPIDAGGRAATPAPTRQASGGVIADVSGQVQNLPVVYQPPKALLLHKPVSFKLVIEALGPGSAKGAFNGDTVTGHAQISRTVTATLSAPAGVTITPLSPATQTVTDIANPTWLWDVTAETPNAATLELSIASLVTIDGVDHPVPIEVYDAQIPVQLSVMDRIQLWIAQIDPIWKWLIGVITVVGGAIGWALGWRLKLRRGGARPDPA
jgi:hypothetical protein